MGKDLSYWHPAPWGRISYRHPAPWGRISVTGIEHKMEQDFCNMVSSLSICWFEAKPEGVMKAEGTARMDALFQTRIGPTNSNLSIIGPLQ